MRWSKKIPLFLFFLILPFLFPPMGLAKKGYSVSARSAIFSNVTTVKRYYGKNVHTRVVPASTTKVMTALLVLEKLSLDQEVTVSQHAPYPQPSKIYVRPGERYRVRDLLYAVLMSSANDASVVLAEAVAGSEEKFVQMMNARAGELGAKNTKFVNAHGLPSPKRRQYTTAYDMMLLFRAAVQYDFFRQAIQKTYHTISSVDGREIALKSHNKSLFLGWKNKIYGKTGYTRAAKSCFVGYIPRGKEICIIAVFGCSRRWSDVRYIVSRYGGFSL